MLLFLTIKMHNIPIITKFLLLVSNTSIHSYLFTIIAELTSLLSIKTGMIASLSSLGLDRDSIIFRRVITTQYSPTMLNHLSYFFPFLNILQPFIKPKIFLVESP